MGFINQWEAPVIVLLLDLGRSPGVHHEPGMMIPLKSLVLDGFRGYIMVYPPNMRNVDQRNGGLGSWPKNIWSVHGSAGLYYLVT